MNAPSPYRVALVGVSGAGKSALARSLGRRLGWPVHDLDEAVARAAGTTVSAVFAREGEAGFRQRERAALAAVAGAPPPLVAATGGGVVLDPVNRERLARSFRVVWLRVDPAEAAARLTGTDDRPLLAGDDPAAALARLAAEREPLYRETAAAVLEPAPGESEDATLERLHLLLGDLGWIHLGDNGL